jgi:hypothetical protein
MKNKIINMGSFLALLVSRVEASEESELSPITLNSLFERTPIIKEIHKKSIDYRSSYKDIFEASDPFQITIPVGTKIYQNIIFDLFTKSYNEFVKFELHKLIESFKTTNEIHRPNSCFDYDLYYEHRGVIILKYMQEALNGIYTQRHGRKFLYNEFNKIKQESELSLLKLGSKFLDVYPDRMVCNSAVNCRAIMREQPSQS